MTSPAQPAHRSAKDGPQRPAERGKAPGPGTPRDLDTGTRPATEAPSERKAWLPHGSAATDVWRMPGSARRCDQCRVVSIDAMTTFGIRRVAGQETLKRSASTNGAPGLVNCDRGGVVFAFEPSVFAFEPSFGAAPPPEGETLPSRSPHRGDRARHNRVPALCDRCTTRDTTLGSLSVYDVVQDIGCHTWAARWGLQPTACRAHLSRTEAQRKCGESWETVNSQRSEEVCFWSSRARRRQEPSRNRKVASPSRGAPRLSSGKPPTCTTGDN